MNGAFELKLDWLKRSRRVEKRFWFLVKVKWIVTNSRIRWWESVWPVGNWGRRWEWSIPLPPSITLHIHIHMFASHTSVLFLCVLIIIRIASLLLLLQLHPLAVQVLTIPVYFSPPLFITLLNTSSCFAFLNSVFVCRSIPCTCLFLMERINQQV